MVLPIDDTNEDRRLRDAVLDALKADDRLSSQPIEIEVEEGRIRLSGQVQSFRRKLAAQEAAATVAGISAIENRIEVAPPENPTDEDVAEDVRALLREDPRLVKPAVVVDVRAGKVTLSGTVASEKERLLAGDVALEASGAREVVNQLLVEPAACGEALVVAEDLEKEIAAHPGMAGSTLRVAISGDVAALSGTARNRVQLDTAIAVVQKVWVGELRVDVTFAG